jgi:hypothetical protein
MRFFLSFVCSELPSLKDSTEALTMATAVLLLYLLAPLGASAQQSWVVGFGHQAGFTWRLGPTSVLSFGAHQRPQL